MKNYTTMLDLSYEHLKVSGVNHTLDEIELVAKNNINTSDFFKFITDRDLEVISLSGNKLVMPRTVFYPKVNSALKDYRIGLLDFKYDLEVIDVHDESIDFKFLDDGGNHREYTLQKDRIMGSKVLNNGDLSILDRYHGYNLILKGGTEAMEISEVLLDDSKMIAYLKEELEDRDKEISQLNQVMGEMALELKAYKEGNHEENIVTEGQGIEVVVPITDESQDKIETLKDICHKLIDKL